MEAKRIVTLLSKQEVHNIGSGLWYQTLTQEAARKMLVSILSWLDPEQICDVTTETSKEERLTKVPLKDIIVSKWYRIQHAITQIREAFQYDYSQAQETSTVYRNTNRRRKKEGLAA